jgi:hypothetical protein
MYADESFTVINKDEMDRKIVTTEDQVPPSLTQLFAQVCLPYIVSTEVQVYCNIETFIPSEKYFISSRFKSDLVHLVIILVMCGKN